MIATVVYHPWVPRWIAVPLCVAWVIAITVSLREWWRRRRFSAQSAAVPPSRSRPYDWQTDDPVLRQPTHVHRRSS